MGDVILRTRSERGTVGSIIGGVLETAWDPLWIVAASVDLSDQFKKLILDLVNQPGDIRISLMLTSLLDESQVENCRSFLEENPHLHTRISTFFFSTRLDSERTLLNPGCVAEEYRSFLRLLCVGREPFAEALGLFRAPPTQERDSFLDESGSSFQRSGILAALGIRSWLPRKEEIVKLTESLLSMYVLAEEKKAALHTNLLRDAEPEAIVAEALMLGMTDEPLISRHFAGMIPPPPDTPFESWRVPFSMKRARKQTHYLQKTVQQDFSEYTSLLEATLDEIHGRIRRQSAISFSAAAKRYRSDLLKDADLGTLSLLLRDYYPAFGEYDEARLADAEEESTGWPPDESLDLFCSVYEVLDDGLDKLPTSRVWAGAAYISLAFFFAAGIFWEPEGWLPITIAAIGLLAPAGLWVYRMINIRLMRKRLVRISQDVFASLTRTFDTELQRILRETRVQLEREIRMDAIGLGERLRQDFDSIPFLFAAPSELEREEIRSEIQRLRNALVCSGIEGFRLDPLPGRLEDLAARIVERVRRDAPPAAEHAPRGTPREVVEEWVDELVGSSILPLEKVEIFRDEFLETASTWRLPALMAPLTDADLHRGFRKVVVLPNADIAYQRIFEAIPRFSGNSIVTLKAWSGPAPGMAVCSVLTGLPESILDQPNRSQNSSDRRTEDSIGIR